MPRAPLWQQLGLPQPKSEASKGPLSLVDNEIYSGIVLPKMPVFVRLDGWKFHNLTKRLRMAQPYDRFFASAMAATAEKFFIPFGAQLAYIFSDEINLLFLKRPAFERVEKVDSVFAGIASAAFSAALRKKYKEQVEAVFDCRCIPLRKGQIARYLIWRQAEAFRNHNNSWAYWLLRRRGLSPKAAAKQLEGLNTAQLFALCKVHKVDLARTPAWQRAGILLYKVPYKKVGWDPVRKKKVRVTRWAVRTDWAPPRFDTVAGKKLLKQILSQSLRA